METDDTLLDNNIDLIIEKYNIILKEIKETNLFSIDSFIKRMEPIFLKTGYRDLIKTNPTTISEYFNPQKINILIIADAGTGDFIIITGAIREIKKNYPNSHITLFARPIHKDLADLCPYADEIYYSNRNYSTINNFLELYNEFIKYSRILLKKKIDICFSFGLYATTNILMYMTGAKKRVTIKPYINESDEKILGSLKWFTFDQVSKFVTNYFVRPLYHVHRVDISFNLLEQYLNINIENKELEIWLNQDDIYYVQKLLKDVKNYPLYGLCMGSTDPTRRYPPEYYAKFAQLVLDNEKNSTFIILGGGSVDATNAKKFLNTIPEKYKKNIINMVNKINIRKSAAILKYCNMYIGNDTGTMHLAAAMKCPVLNLNPHPHSIPINLGDSIVVYRPYNVPAVIVIPKKHLPRCEDNSSFHHINGCRLGITHCIMQIKSDTIYRGFLELKRKKDLNPTIIW